MTRMLDILEDFFTYRKWKHARFVNTVSQVATITL